MIIDDYVQEDFNHLDYDVYHLGVSSGKAGKERQGKKEKKKMSEPKPAWNELDSDEVKEFYAAEFPFGSPHEERIAELEAENGRLRAALRQILESDYEMGASIAHRALGEK